MSGARGFTSTAATIALAIFVVAAPAPATAKPLKKCPKNTSHNFYVGPNYDRSKNDPKPTGVLGHGGICTFPTLSEGLAHANPVEGTVIAVGATKRKPVNFDKEPVFPLVVGNRTTLTTYEDLDPNRRHSKSIKAGHYAVSNFGDSPTLDLGEGSVVHGFALLDESKKSADASIVCDESGVDLADLKLDGKGKKGSKIVTGLEMESECSGSFDNLEIDGFSGHGVHQETNPLASRAVFSHLEVRDSATDGMVINGAASLDEVTVEGSGRSGVVVNTPNAVSITNPHFVENDNFGLMVERTGAASLTVSGDRPTLRSLAEISGNGADGVHIGASTPAGDIHVSIAGQDIFENDEAGIEVEDQGARTYEIILLDNDVYTNSGNGALIGPSHIGQAVDDPEPAVPDVPTFAQNRFHNNGLNQVVFDGGGRGFNFEIDSPTHSCDAGANAVYAYTAKQVFGIFAQGQANVTVRHTQFEGGGTGLKDFSAQSGSTINVAENCPAITTVP
jgi:hypothetical protein